MRTSELLEDQEATTNSGELTLGMGSLLGIFFGVALLCGVFFGFGYMMGHRTPATSVVAEASSESPKTRPTAPKPSAQVLQDSSDSSRVVVPASSAELSDGRNANDSPQPESAPALVPAIPAAPSRAVATASAKPVQVPVAASPAATVQPALATTGQIMVQIAAVKNRPDAEALAAALQKNGFNPSIRNENQDKLLHVQVGPFQNRDDAKVMRQKLSNAGYNAFIK
jgi:DedD protein